MVESDEENSFDRGGNDSSTGTDEDDVASDDKSGAEEDNETTHLDGLSVDVAKAVAKLEDMVDRFRSGPALSASNANTLVILQQNVTNCFYQGEDIESVLDLARHFYKLYSTVSKIARFESLKHKAGVVCISPECTFGSVAESAETANAAAEQAKSPKMKAFMKAVGEALSSIPNDDNYPDVSVTKFFDNSTRHAIGNLSHLCLAIETFRLLKLYTVFNGLQTVSSLDLMRKAAELAVAICPSMVHLDVQDAKAIIIWARKISILTFVQECLCPALMSDTHHSHACEVACDLRKYTTETKGNRRYKAISKPFRQAQKVKIGGGKCSKTDDYCAGKGKKFADKRLSITQMFYDLIMMRSIASILPHQLFPCPHDFIAYKLFSSMKVNSTCHFPRDFFSGEMSEMNKEKLVEKIRKEVEKQIEHMQKMDGRRVIVIEHEAQVAAIEKFIRFEA